MEAQKIWAEIKKLKMFCRGKIDTSYWPQIDSDT